MFRLIKLALYAVAGYALYQFYLGMTEQEGQSAMAQGNPRQNNENKDAGDIGGARMTGGGKGVRAQTLEPSGMSVSNRVGRGVIHR